MRRLDRQRRKKKIRFCIVIALLVLLVGWICFYPWRTERKKEVGDNVVQTAASTSVTSDTTGTPDLTGASSDTTTSSTSTNIPIQSTGTSTPVQSQPAAASSQVQLTKAEQILEGMTLTDKIYQMMFVRPEAITGVQTVTAAGEMTRTALLKYPVGGIVYSKPNMLSKDQIKTVVANTQSYAKVPLFIATDEEGGIVNRLMDSVGTTKIDSMYTYKDNGTKTAENNAEIIATDMHALGFNLDFAPVADVWSNEYNSVIGKRAYSDDFQQAAELVGAAVNGFHEGGVLCTLKHFPGHGDTAEDTHTSTAYVRRSKDKLEKNEFLPFKSGIKAGADLVMVGHLIVEDIDGTTPASLSEKIVTEILRKELKFEGLIITDSLEMDAVSKRYTAGEAVVNAIKAGNDILLEPENLDEAVQGILEAVGNGEITETQLDEHVLRILEVKEAAGILA